LKLRKTFFLQSNSDYIWSVRRNTDLFCFLGLDKLETLVTSPLMDQMVRNKKFIQKKEGILRLLPPELSGLNPASEQLNQKR